MVYIGKEANNIDEKLVYDFILKLTPEKAREIGIKHRSALAYLKKKAKEGNLNLKTKNIRGFIFNCA